MCQVYLCCRFSVVSRQFLCIRSDSAATWTSQFQKVCSCRIIPLGILHVQVHWYKLLIVNINSCWWSQTRVQFHLVLQRVSRCTPPSRIHMQISRSSGSWFLQRACLCMRITKLAIPTVARCVNSSWILSCDERCHMRPTRHKTLDPHFMHHIAYDLRNIVRQ